MLGSQVGKYILKSMKRHWYDVMLANGILILASSVLVFAFLTPYPSSAKEDDHKERKHSFRRQKTLE